MLADIMQLRAVRGLRPVTRATRPSTLLKGGEKLELAGFEIDVLFTPGHSPGHVTYSMPDRAGDLLRRRPVPGLGRPDRPARRRLGDAAVVDREAGRLAAGRQGRVDTTVYPGHMGITTLGAERRTNPFLAELALAIVADRAHQAPRGTYDLLPEEAAAPAAHRRRGRRAARGSRLRRDRDADLRGHRALHAHRRRGDRHRAQGDVHVRRPLGPLAHAAAGGNGSRLPRLRRARHAQAPAAGEALVRGADVPLRGAAVRALPPAQPGRARR